MAINGQNSLVIIWSEISDMAFDKLRRPGNHPDTFKTIFSTIGLVLWYTIIFKVGIV